MARSATSSTLRVAQLATARASHRRSRTTHRRQGSVRGKGTGAQMTALRTIERKMGGTGVKFALAALAISACIFAQTQTVSENLGTGQQPMAVAVNETTTTAHRRVGKE